MASLLAAFRTCKYHVWCTQWLHFSLLSVHSSTTCGALSGFTSRCFPYMQIPRVVHSVASLLSAVRTYKYHVWCTQWLHFSLLSVYKNHVCCTQWLHFSLLSVHTSTTCGALSGFTSRCFPYIQVPLVHSVASLLAAFCTYKYHVWCTQWLHFSLLSVHSSTTCGALSGFTSRCFPYIQVPRVVHSVASLLAAFHTCKYHVWCTQWLHFSLLSVHASTTCGALSGFASCCFPYIQIPRVVHSVASLLAAFCTCKYHVWCTQWLHFSLLSVHASTT